MIVSGSNAETNAEILGLRIYSQAGGEPITRRTVETILEQWKSHPPDCRCGAPCYLAATVSVSRVWCVVWGWQASIARTRRLAQH